MQRESFRRLANDLIRRKVNIIVTAGPQATQAAKTGPPDHVMGGTHAYCHRSAYGAERRFMLTIRDDSTHAQSACDNKQD
jgi:hypothetical protein